MKNEAAVQRKVQNAIKNFFENSFCYKTTGGLYGRAGLPDIIACIDGTFVAIEVKYDKLKKVDFLKMLKMASDIQKDTLRNIHQAGGSAFILVYNINSKAYYWFWVSSITTPLHVHTEYSLSNKVIKDLLNAR